MHIRVRQQAHMCQRCQSYTPLKLRTSSRFAGVAVEASFGLLKRAGLHADKHRADRASVSISAKHVYPGCMHWFDTCDLGIARVVAGLNFPFRYPLCDVFVWHRLSPEARTCLPARLQIATKGHAYLALSCRTGTCSWREGTVR